MNLVSGSEQAVREAEVHPGQLARGGQDCAAMCPRYMATSR